MEAPWEGPPGVVVMGAGRDAVALFFMNRNNNSKAPPTYHPILFLFGPFMDFLPPWVTANSSPPPNKTAVIGFALIIVARLFAVVVDAPPCGIIVTPVCSTPLFCVV